MAEVVVRFDTFAVQEAVRRILKQKKRKALSPEVKKATAGLYAQAISKYVPYKSGDLLNSATIVKTDGGYGVKYSAINKRGRKKTDYAGVQYAPEKYGYDEAYWERSTPNTYSHWNTHLTRLEREAFYREVAGIMMEAMND